MTFPRAFQCYKPPPHKVYGCICYSPTRRIALVKGRISGKWSFPKGHLKLGERSIDCALRELKEETSICISRDIPYMNYKYLASGGYFIYEVDGEQRMFPEDCMEIEDCGWFFPEEMGNMNCNVDVNRFLSHARYFKDECPNTPTLHDVHLDQDTILENVMDAMS
jgi:8-oxo-dGTP pyrophosphatase MutT (NUDIX family)